MLKLIKIRGVYRTQAGIYHQASQWKQLRAKSR